MGDDELHVFSDRLSHVLDVMGYSLNHVQWRRQMYVLRDAIWSQNLTESRVFTVGSKGEGITKFFESDHDMLFVKRKSVCREGRYKMSFRSRGNECPPGYAILWKQGDSLSSIESSKKFLSSHREHVKNVNPPGYNLPRLSGPAQTLSIRSFNMDAVYGYRCQCPTILHEWSTRRRKHDWPSKALIQEISKLDAFLVAKAPEDSQLQLEWRLCFNLAENRLVQSLDSKQTKLLVLTKFVLKDILKPNNKELTSFIVKNVVFWLFESRDCKDVCLFVLLRKALRILKKAIKNNFLSYYMIPPRNLLHKRMTEEQRRAMLEKVDECLNNGPWFLYQSDRLSPFLLQNLENQVPVLQTNLNLIEEIHLQRYLICLYLEKPGLTEKQIEESKRRITELTERLADLVCPRWRHYKKGKFNFEASVWKPLAKVLSGVCMYTKQTCPGSKNEYMKSGNLE